MFVFTATVTDGDPTCYLRRVFDEETMPAGRTNLTVDEPTIRTYVHVVKAIVNHAKLLYWRQTF